MKSGIKPFIKARIQQLESIIRTKCEILAITGADTSSKRRKLGPVILPSD